ncbi:hypothetical protein GOEFS_014_00100 [Gordonia effusa NBRC 100432]|uniref:Uncharacterized protein n=2 Tax=Gordonia effusa TaxID=263908 RepID=H0QVB7_9ACTN|nr:hypothetical protein GOEFS_014_00100 [Gordonia effusa NBRC 100432]
MSDRHHKDALSDLPPWGLEIMMGLYGPRTIEAALESERPTPLSADQSMVALSAVGFVPVYVPEQPTSAQLPNPRADQAATVGEFGTAQVSPAMAEFAAIDALGRKLGHLFRRH